MSADDSVQPLREVHIDGLAVLKIIKHCNSNLPTLVSGSLLGVDVNGILEVTYSYPFPLVKAKKENSDGNNNNDDDEDKSAGANQEDGREYQTEMMKRLRDMNIDDNCVGWYQSTYLGTNHSNDVLGYQYSFQTSDELADNTAVIMYDPVQGTTNGGKLALKAYRLTDKYIKMRRNKENKYIDPSEILQELPVKIKNGGHVSAFVRCLQDSHKEVLSTSCEAVSMANSSSYLERNIEIMNSWLDDLVEENRKFASYARSSSKIRADHIRWTSKRLLENAARKQDGEDPLPLNIEDSDERPLPECTETRLEPLLMIGQLEKYASQVNDHVDASLQKIAVTSTMYNNSD